MTDLSTSIIRVITYFDIFQYPVKAVEIFQNIELNPVTQNLIENELEYLCSAGIIFQYGEFYSLNKNESIFARRIEGNIRAEKKMKTAKLMTKLIASFPFVRGIMISGSLSKGCIDSKADIDFFICTEPKRLWITRTLLVLFKKIFLLNSKKLFCVNYFIDSNSLEIEEKNIFSATELVTLIPTYNYELYKAIIENNYWAKDFRPNFPLREPNHIIPQGLEIFKKIGEFILGGKIGDLADDYFLKLSRQVWQKKFKSFAKEDFAVALQSEKYVSRHHPKFYQKQVLNVLDEKTNFVLSKLQRNLTP